MAALLRHWQNTTSKSETYSGGYKTEVQSKAQNKAQRSAACGHVSASSQSLRFILSLRINSSFITSGPYIYAIF